MTQHTALHSGCDFQISKNIILEISEILYLVLVHENQISVFLFHV